MRTLCWRRSKNIRGQLRYEDVSGVGDGGDDSGGDHELFPTLSEVDDVDALVVALVHVGVHQVGAVLSTNLHLRGHSGTLTLAATM